ncbi:dockerin type I repeat-containing protein [Ruminococcus sp.]|uniref:dockerin type I repeat-containing protein n=1 Tax=Ruminococcus sp. TaxID=41978 RepID=UPI003AAC1959
MEKNIIIGLKFYYGGFELTHETNQEKRKHLSSMMLVGCTVTALTANASTGGQLCSKYATNPNGKVGIQKTITIDGSVTVDDVTLLQFYVAGDKSLDANAQLKADVNRDGIIDILDCTEIQLYVAGNIPNLG